jgi:DNA-binding MarR family transcriptional regulator
MVTDLDVAADLRLAIGRLARRIRQTETGGLTPSQLSALATLDDIGPARLSDVAAAEAIAPPTATKIIATLESAGLVTRSPDPDDRRSTRIAITASGRAALRRIRSQRTAFLQRRLAALDDDSRQRLLAAIPVLVALADDGDPGEARP